MTAPRFLLLLMSLMCSYAYRLPPLDVRMMSDVSASSFALTPKLLTYAEGLRRVPDEKLRYQQLLFLAAKCAPMDASLKVDMNKVHPTSLAGATPLILPSLQVPGCLSTVHVHATCDEDKKIFFVGDSDAQLTKGLVALLVNGLSGHTADEIMAVDPAFINYAGISTSLTPGRNSGFLNMLKLMKEKARLLAAPAATPAASSVHASITQKLSMLKPQLLEVEDDSSKHSGHAGVAGVTGGETHFNVKIVAACFEGLSLVQRHRMVYTMLAKEIAGGVHALSIIAKTPNEL